MNRKLGRVLKRTHKQEYNNTDNPLPEKLAFLMDVPFYAITEVRLPDSERKQTRVEILPRSLRKLVEESNNAFALREENKKLKVDFSEANERKKQSDELVSLLKHNINQLMENNGSTEDTPHSIIKSSMQLFYEKGFKPYGPPFQGGSPGSGKKR